METNSSLSFESPSLDQVIHIDSDLTRNPVLARLIEEIKSQNESTVHNYDRVHNRHNR